MKLHHVFAFALAAALTAAPTFAQEADKTDKADAPRAQEQAPVEKDKAAKPAEADKAKADDRKADSREMKDEKANSHDASRMPQSDQEPAAQDRDKDNKDNKDREMKGADNKGQASDRDRSAHHQFRPDAKEKLRASYHGNVDKSHRVTVVQQQVLPVEIRTQIQPVPVDVVSYLGPAPDGFMYGFVDGYCVVYDPNTFFVIDVIDLF